MTVGNILLWAAGLAVLGAMTYYVRPNTSGDRPVMAERLVVVHLLLLTLAGGVLFRLFLTDQFQCAYVAHNSSRDLPLYYKISAFWAGQEGTFLLWAWITAVLAVSVMRRRGELTALTMAYLLGTQVFLMVLLYVRSPFAAVPGSEVPPDGNGLNPLLKDPWMVVHPPIIFVGYAAFAVPFAYAMAALTRRRWSSLAAAMFPWAAFATATLGLGIFIGGFWAYKVLGWGGYWGWDPVENASLVPWLMGLALVHALLIFRIRGQLGKTTLLLAVGCYLLVVYGTFLTRSGVLADFSVHSFTDAGINVYLTGYLIGVTFLSIALLVFGARSMPSTPMTKAVNSREFGLVLSILLFGLTAGFVLVGTSSPILTGIGGNPANVTTAYYNAVALPLGIFIALVLGFSPFLLFERIRWGDLFKAAMPSFLLATVATLVVILWTPVVFAHAVLVFVAVLALGSNLIAAVRFSQARLTRIAGHLTHFGFAIMVLGIIASSAYSGEERLKINSGDHGSAFGYDIAFRGAVDGKHAEEGYLDLTLSRGADTCAARPKLYMSEYTQQVMRTPYVKKNLLYDLYVAPLDHERPEGDSNIVALVKGSSARYGDRDLTFDRFETGEHSQTGAMRVGAVIRVAHGGDTTTVVPALEITGDGHHPFPVNVSGTELVLSLVGMNVEQRQVFLKIDDPNTPARLTNPERVVLAVSRKPLTSFVWSGCVLVSLGSGLSFWRRRREAALMG
ncbi:MAG: cytochrome c biogenesis protein CcsA [Candidatus Zixiibacteriota bacterium]